MIDGKLRTEMVDCARRLHARGWVANHDGNLSARLAPGRFLCTPTATSKAEVTAEGLVIVDDTGARVSGGKPFSEIGLHLTVYRQRPDVKAVVHAHPVTATGFAVAGCALDVPFLAEAVVSLGPDVPLVPTAAPGPASEQALLPFAATHDAVLLGGHGVLAWGDSIQQAYLRVDLVEHLCRIFLVAQQLGGARPLPQAMMATLLEARRRAGLGPQARGLAPAPKEAAKPAAAATPTSRDDLANLIREEIAAAMRK